MADEAGGNSYVGLLTGYSATSPDYSEPGFSSGGGGRNPRMEGAAVGIYAGHDFKVGRVTLGIEGDFGLLNNDGPADPDAANSYTAFRSRWNGHVRSRLGLKLGSSTKVYAAGGAALYRMVTDDTDPDWGISTQTHLGWTLGGGVERKVGRRFSIRLEYLHDSFGARTGTITYFGVPDYSPRTKPDNDSVRFGLAVRF